LKLGVVSLKKCRIIRDAQNSLTTNGGAAVLIAPGGKKTVSESLRIFIGSSLKNPPLKRLALCRTTGGISSLVKFDGHESQSLPESCWFAALKDSTLFLHCSIMRP